VNTKTKLENLQKFLEDAHANGTDCITTETKLEEAVGLVYAIAEKLFPGIKREYEWETIKEIVSELEQMEKTCSLPAQIMDDDSVYGA
jgi:hypothetical protein